MTEEARLKSLPIPKTTSDLTADWIVNATGLRPDKNGILINDNIQDGVGFLSNLCRVSFQDESGVNQSILVKLLPDHPELRAMTIDQDFDNREIQFYSLAYPQLVSTAPELRNNLCKFYSGKKSDKGKEDLEYASMLIIEDLKPLGYEMLDPESPNWKENLEKIVKFVAELNAAGLVLKDMKPTEFSGITSFCMGANDDEKTNMLMELGVVNSDKLDELLLKHGYPKQMRIAYNELSKYVKEIMNRTITKGTEFPCIIHGDIWPPNIMVKEGSGSPIKVVDWQLLGYRDASFELSIAILSCLPKANFNRETVDIYLKLYWKEFIQACKAKGRSYIERSEDEFIQFFNTWGMAYGYYWWVLSLDSFPNDQDRLCKAFEVMYEEYKITEFLLKDNLSQ